MGTDMHAALEFGYRGNRGEPDPAGWQWLGTVLVGRDYALFSHLAGVRHDPDADRHRGVPRGLPTDVADRTRAHFDSWSGHDPTWFSLPELLEEDWSSHTPTWQGFLDWATSWGAPERYRVVLWFDS